MYREWDLYIDEPAMLDWYPFPPELEREIAASRPEEWYLAPMPVNRYATVHEAAIRYAGDSVAALKLPGHGHDHFEAVELAGRAVVNELERQRGKEFDLAPKQALALGLRLHDCHHPGSTFRADAPQPERLWRPDLGTDVSVEWVSALAVNEFGRHHHLPLPWRVFQTMVVWASTYGGQTPRGASLGIPDVRPQGLWGRVMRASDVRPPADPADWLYHGIAVVYGEVNVTAPPATWQDFVASRRSFLGYVEHCFNDLDAVAGCQVTAALGWRDNLGRMRETAEELDRRRGPYVALAERMLANFGVHLS